jgi:hypothetical protein
MAEWREVDDREPRMTESDGRTVVEERSRVIGTPMADRPHAALERILTEST